MLQQPSERIFSANECTIAIRKSPFEYNDGTIVENKMCHQNVHFTQISFAGGCDVCDEKFDICAWMFVRNSGLSIGITTANWQPTRRKRKTKEGKLDPRGKYRYSQKREISQMDVRTRIRRHLILPSVPAAMPTTKDRSPMSFQIYLYLLLCSLIGRGQLAGFVQQFRF